MAQATKSEKKKIIKKLRETFYRERISDRKNSSTKYIRDILKDGYYAEPPLDINLGLGISPPEDSYASAAASYIAGDIPNTPERFGYKFVSTTKFPSGEEIISYSWTYPGYLLGPCGFPLLSYFKEPAWNDRTVRGDERAIEVVIRKLFASSAESVVRRR